MRENNKSRIIIRIALSIALSLVLYVSNFAGLIPGETVKAATSITGTGISSNSITGCSSTILNTLDINTLGEYRLDDNFPSLQITINADNITLDLNGNNIYSLTISSENFGVTVNGSGYIYQVDNKGSLTFSNASIYGNLHTLPNSTTTQNGGQVKSLDLGGNSIYNLNGGTIQSNVTLGSTGINFTMCNDSTIDGSVQILLEQCTFTQQGGTITGTVEGPGYSQTGGTRAGAYTIAFDLNGSGGSNPSSITTTKKVINTNVVDVLASLPNEPTWEGHNFQGWYTQQDGGEQVRIDSTTFNASTTLYAHWEQSGNGSGTVTPGTPAPSPAPVAPTVSEPETDDISSDDSSSGDYLDELYTVLDNAVTLAADGKPHTIYWNEGTALPYSVMKTLADNPNITLVFSYVYQGVPYIITIPGSRVVVDPGIPWYGPLYLNAVYGKVKAPDLTGNTQASTGTYSVKAGDTLSAIAARLHTSIKHLQELNHIKDPDKIKPGQILKY